MIQCFVGILIVALGAALMWTGGKIAENGWDKWHKSTKTIQNSNNFTGFDIRAKGSEIEDNIAMDHKTGFKADIENSTFKRNISKGTTPQNSEELPTQDSSIQKKADTQKKTKSTMLGNVIINCGTAVSGQFDDTKIEHNLTDGNVLNEETAKEKIKILDYDLTKLEKTKEEKTMFEQASYYQTLAESYAAYGEWEKAINCAYKSFDSYLKIPDGDNNPILKTRKDKEEAAVYVCAKLNFFSNTVRKETDKDYIYFLKKLLDIAKENEHIYGIKLIKEKISQQENKNNNK